MKKTDDNLYITKGEFFSYFVYENNLTSQNYSQKDIENCEDGTVEANIIVEWEYLSEEQALKGLKSVVDKETVVTVCANATFDLVEGNVSDIKDAELLNEPQLIANAYASGLCDLDNGYFDGAKKMSFSDCEDIINRTKEYTANFHYEANTEETETEEGVYEQNDDNYKDGDIIIQFDEPVTSNESENDDDVIGTSFNETSEYNKLNISDIVVPLSYKHENNTSQIRTLEKMAETEEQNMLNLASGSIPTGINGFQASIAKDTFEKALGNPNVGDTVIITRSQIQFTDRLVSPTSEIIGLLKNKRVVGNHYECTFDCPEFEQAIQKKNVKKGNSSGINKKSFKIEKTEYAGWKFNFDISSGAVKIDAEKAFTVNETGRKQDWQNSKKTMNAKVSFKLSDFNIDANNLKSFANKKGKGYLKITCDSDLQFQLSSSLRYTPDSNRNGKFPSNWNNSRWTDSDSKGAKTIKIARFTPSLYGVVGADIYIYLLISVDGKITFTSSIDDGGIKITASNGNISTEKLGTAKQSAEINVNVHGRLGVDAKVTIFSFINVVEYDVGADANIYAVVNLYYENKIQKEGIYADVEGLDEYGAGDNKFNYCIGIQVDLGVSGKLKDSGVKLILNLISKGNSLDFERTLWSGGFHFEDGSFVSKCTRGDDMSDEIEKSKNDDVELGVYKVVLDKYNSTTVSLKAIPSETMNLMDTKNSITVSSNDSSICTAKYNKSNKTIIIEATGEGSTEVIVKAKKGHLWWKKSCTQKISVTVNSQYIYDGSSTVCSFDLSDNILNPIHI